jgi:hypothetical protein
VTGDGARRPLLPAHPGPARSAHPARSVRTIDPARPRLAWLHLASRQAPKALATLAACGVFLGIALRAHWIQGSGSLAQQVPLLIECAAAMIIALTTRNPFGEAERSAGPRLAGLRLAASLAMSGAALGALAAGAAAGRLPGGTADLLRNLAGLTGTGLLAAGVLGGALGWIGPLAYTAIAEFSLTSAWPSPWLWPGRPPHDLGAALCAGLVGAAGLALITIRGSRDRGRE